MTNKPEQQDLKNKTAQELALDWIKEWQTELIMMAQTNGDEDCLKTIIDALTPPSDDAVDVETLKKKILNLKTYNDDEGRLVIAIIKIIDNIYLTQKPDDGMVLVPREPTDAMIDEATMRDRQSPFRMYEDIYKAMIAQHLKED